MLFLLDWLVLASLANVVAGTTGPWLLPACRPLPAPWWAAVVLGAGLYNRRLLRRPRSLALVLAANLPPLAAALAGPAIWQAAAGPWWPGALPGMLDVALLWPLAAYVLCRPQDEREFAGWWEGGAVVVLLVALGGSVGDRAAGFRLASAILYLAAGLARLALGLARSSRPAPGDGRHPLLPLVLLVAGGGVGLGFFLALPAAAHLCREALGLLWQALILLGRGLAYLIDLLGLNRPLTATQPGLRLPKNPTAPVEEAIIGQYAPLWLLLILWSILAGLLVFAAYCICLYVRQWIADLRRVRLALPPPARRSLDHPRLWEALKAWGLLLWRRLRSRLRFLWREWRAVAPTDVPGLYLYFLAWGRRGRQPRRPWETPHEYLTRLLRHPDLAGALRKELQRAVIELTEAYTRERYGGERRALDPGQIRTLYRLLRSRRLRPGVRGVFKSRRAGVSCDRQILR